VLIRYVLTLFNFEAVCSVAPITLTTGVTDLGSVVSVDNSASNLVVNGGVFVVVLQHSTTDLPKHKDKKDVKYQKRR
jgi:hypothetical protein